MIDHVSIDFETYSAAGYRFDPAVAAYVPLNATPPYGLPAIGAPAYAEHPSTEVLSLAYDLHDGKPVHLWLPGMPPPVDLFARIAAGATIAAMNSIFEYWIWSKVCAPRMGWPPVHVHQFRDTAALARAYGVPGSLAKAGAALGTDVQKDKDGTRLLNKFSKPRKPTKTNPSTRTMPALGDPDTERLYKYNIRDVEAENAILERLPPLSPTELEVWKLDQSINVRGVHIDRPTLESCNRVVDACTERLTAELNEITGGAVRTASELQRMAGWLSARGVSIAGLAADDVKRYLIQPIPPDARRVLEIRQVLNSSSVKKTKAISRRLTADGRLHDLFAYCGAQRTGRWAGRGAQPQNQPKAGPSVIRCECSRYHGTETPLCPWCGRAPNSEPVKWSSAAVDDVAEMLTWEGIEHTLPRHFPDPLLVVSGVIRGLFCAAPGHDLVCSDYSAIESVVTAAIAGEEWRLDVFRTHGKIYEMGASKITGIPFDDYLRHKERTGEHHPTRNTVGKIAELASGFGGGVGAWKKFGADRHIGSDEKIRAIIRQWRDASPAIPALWHGLERAATLAIERPGECFAYRGVSYVMRDRVLFCMLPSGRTLQYHEATLQLHTTPWGAPTQKILYRGTDINGNWTWLDTWGGKLTENVVQAVSRDIMAHAMLAVERAGYPVVLHVHDEIISEVPEGAGSVEEFERIMGTLPAWAASWPIRAAGGWRGKRFRKD